jgi:hypothetical protein
MNQALIVLEQDIFLLRELIRLERDCQGICRLRRGFQVSLFAFMNPLH